MAEPDPCVMRGRERWAFRMVDLLQLVDLLARPGDGNQDHDVKPDYPGTTDLHTRADRGEREYD